MIKDEALRMALEALEYIENNYMSLPKIGIEAITYLRQAIEQAEKQDEPVAMRYDFDGYGYKYIDNGSGSDWQTRIKDAEPLYTTPQRTWVGMTDEEKAQFVVAYYPSNWDRKTAVSLMNDYEKYLKERNT